MILLICNKIDDDLSKLEYEDVHVETKHQEEMFEITAGNKERDSVRQKLKECIPPFDVDTRYGSLFNSVTGESSSSSSECR